MRKTRRNELEISEDPLPKMQGGGSYVTFSTKDIHVWKEIIRGFYYKPISKGHELHSDCEWDCSQPNKTVMRY